MLAAAAEVVCVRGPKLKAVMSSMDRSLGKRLGTGTWDSVVATLVAADVLGAARGALRPRHAVLDPAAGDAVLGRAPRTPRPATSALDARTALVLAMTGPASLLELVAPDRRTRKHARQRIDHALDDELAARHRRGRPHAPRRGGHGRGRGGHGGHRRAADG